MAATGRVRITEQECAALTEQATAEQPLPLVFAPGAVSILVTGDGSAAWALRALCDMRGAR